MEIARIEVGRTTGVCTRRERIPAGIAGASVQVSFTDPVWGNLIKTVVFRGKETRIAEFDGNVAVIPHEVIPEPRIALYFGIFGHDPESDLQIPLIEVRLGTTEASTDADADPGTDPTLPIWAQLQQEIEEIKQRADTFLSDVFQAMNLEAEVKSTYDRETGMLTIDMKGDNMGMALVKTEIFDSVVGQVMEGLTK